MKKKQNWKLKQMSDDHFGIYNSLFQDIAMSFHSVYPLSHILSWSNLCIIVNWSLKLPPLLSFRLQFCLGVVFCFLFFFFFACRNLREKKIFGVTIEVVYSVVNELRKTDSYKLTYYIPRPFSHHSYSFHSVAIF